MFNLKKLTNKIFNLKKISQNEAGKSYQEIYKENLEYWVNKVKKYRGNYEIVPEELKQREEIQQALLEGWIKRVKENPHYYKDIPEELKQREEIQQALLESWINYVKKYPTYHKEISEEFKQRKEIQQALFERWINYLKENPYNYRSVPEELKQREEIQQALLEGWIKRVKANEFNYKDIPEESKNIEEKIYQYMLRTIKSTEYAYKEIPESFKTESNILNFIRQNIKVLNEIPEDFLISHPNILTESLKIDSKAALSFPNTKEYKNVRKKGIEQSTIDVLQEYKPDDSNLDIQYIINKIKSKNLFLYLNENINIKNYKDIIHSKLGWSINEPELLEQQNIGQFLVTLKDQDNAVKFLRLRKEYFENNGVWENNLKVLDRYGAEVKAQKILNKVTDFNIEKDVLQNFIIEFSKEGYEDEDIIEFSQRATISSKQNIKPYSISLSDEWNHSLLFEITEKTNPVNVVLSKVNGCCQNIAGEASEAVYDGLSNPNSAFLAVYDTNRKKNKDPLVAMSWLRLGQDRTLYLDNIEVTQSYSQDWVSNLFLKFSQDLKSKFGYKNVLSGIGYSKIDFDNEKVNVNFNNLTNNEIYTDLDEGAHILAKRKLFNLKKVSQNHTYFNLKKISQVENNYFDKEFPEMLYHGTFLAYLPNIKKFGLNPFIAKQNFDWSEKGVLYLSTDPELAKSFVEVSENEEIPEEYFHEIISIGVKVSDLDLTKLEKDNNMQYEKDSEDKSFIYRGIIPYQFLIFEGINKKSNKIFNLKKISKELLEEKEEYQQFSISSYNERYTNEKIAMEDLIELHRLEYLISFLNQKEYIENNVKLLKLKLHFFGLSNKILKILKEGFQDWLNAHSGENWIEEHDEELLLGKGIAIGFDGFYKINIQNIIKEKILDIFLENSSFFNNVYDNEGTYNYKQILSYASLRMICLNLDETTNGLKILNRYLTKNNLIESFELFKETNNDIENEYRDFIEEFGKEDELIEWILENEDYISLIKEFKEEILSDWEMFLPEDWWDKLVLDEQDTQELIDYRYYSNIVAIAKKIQKKEPEIQDPLKVAKERMKFREREFINRNKGPMYDFFEETAKTIGREQWEESIEISTEDPEYLRNIIKNIQVSQNRIINSLQSYNFQERSIAITFALNTVHSSGKMGELFGLYESDLDKLSNLDVSEWNEELKRIANKIFNLSKLSYKN